MLLRELTYKIKEENGEQPFDDNSEKELYQMFQDIDTSSSVWRQSKRGKTNTGAVAGVQWMLNTLNYGPIRVDGWFGKKTARAVQKFQKDNDLTVDGDPGKNTIAKMKDIAKERGNMPDDIQISYLDDPDTEYKTGDLGTDQVISKTKKAIDAADAKPTDGAEEPGRIARQAGPATIARGPEQKFNPDGTIRGSRQAAANPANTFKANNERAANLVRSKDFKGALAIINGDQLIKRRWQSTPVKGANMSLYDYVRQMAAQSESQKKNEDLEEKQVWARKGKSVVRKYRCSSGSRKGRVVSNVSQCFAAPDVKKRATLKRTKARLGSRMARKAKRTKRINPASIRLKALNR
jgi:peptidoglycan hydrolase-like protein with peptidoglycan-binding domain